MSQATLYCGFHKDSPPFPPLLTDIFLLSQSTNPEQGARKKMRHVGENRDVPLVEFEEAGRQPVRHLLGSRAQLSKNGANFRYAPSSEETERTQATTEATRDGISSFTSVQNVPRLTARPAIRLGLTESLSDSWHSPKMQWLGVRGVVQSPNVYRTQGTLRNTWTGQHPPSFASLSSWSNCEGLVSHKVDVVFNSDSKPLPGDRFSQ